MANALLVTKGTGGDLMPFLGIGSRLKARGHAVTLLTHCYYKDMVRRAGLDFAALDTTEEFEQFIKDGPLLNNPRDIPVFFWRHILPKIQAEAKMVEELCHSVDTVVVARHTSDIAARMVAEKLGMSFVRVFVVAAQVNTISILEELCNCILAPDINRARAEFGLSPLQDWHSWLQYPKWSIATWPDWFAAPDSGWPPGVLPIGFVNYDEAETGDISDAVEEVSNNNGELPILITGGLGTFLGSEFYTVSAKAVELLNRPGILVTRFQELVPDCLPEKIKWFESLPFASLMPNVAVVIHHGGTSTSARAIAAGVPQLVLPFGGERPDTAARLQRLGIAEFLLPPQWQPELVAESLSRLTSSPRVWRRCRELAHQFHSTDAAAIGCEIIERVVASNYIEPGLVQKSNFQ